MPEIISSFTAFEDKFKDAAFLQAKADARLRALKRYFKKGGVVKFATEGSVSWPKLSYPSKSRVSQLLEETVKLKELFEGKRKEWIKAYNDARVYHLKLHAKKLVNPVFWKHLSKKLTDKDYRLDAETVKLPSELVADRKYKAMVEMFVTNLDYRKQLAETVKNSIVYSNSKYLDELQDFRKGVSNAQIEDLNKKVREIDSDLEMLRIMQKWAED